MNKTLRTVAFQFAPDVSSLKRKFFTLSFPEHWKPFLRELQAENLKRKPEDVSIPIRSLNKALRALVPDLTSIGARAGRRGENDWLY